MTVHPVNRALALALAVIALPAFWPVSPTAHAPTITGKHPDEIGVIELTQADSRLSIRLDRLNDRWELTAPVSAPADAVTIAGPVLGLARATARSQYSLDQIAPDKIGLAPPRWQVRFDDLIIQFGDTDPTEGLRYVRVGNRIFRIDDVDPALFDADYSDLVSRQLIPPQLRVAQIAFSSSDGRGAATADIIEAWSRAQAIQVRRATRADFQDSDTDIEVGLVNGDRLFFRAAATATALTLVRPDLDLAYVLPASAQAELLAAPTPQSEP